MTPIEQARAGSGYFQWNFYGWFGASVGSTAWMVVAAGFLLYYDQASLAFVPLGGMAMTLVVAVQLWSRRDRVNPFAALMMLLGALAVILPVVWCVITRHVSADAAAAMNWPQSNFVNMAVAAMPPLMMLWFYFLEHSTRPLRK